MIPPFVLSVSSWSPGVRQASSDQYFLGWTRHQPRARAGSCLTHWSARQCPHCWHCHQVPIITVKTIHHLATLAIASCRHSHSLDFCSCQLWEEHWGHANLYSSPRPRAVCVRCIISEVGYCEWRPCHSNNITRPLWWSLLSSAGQLLTSNTVSSHSVLGYNSSSWSSIGHSVLYLVGTTQRIHWSGLRYNFYNGDMWENLYILDLSILYSPELNVC